MMVWLLSLTLHLHATAYCGHGRMASGVHPFKGAVAHHSLPFGTKVLIEGKGPFVVMDRGPRGVVDVWVPRCAEARRFGRRLVKVEILKDE